MKRYFLMLCALLIFGACSMSDSEMHEELLAGKDTAKPGEEPQVIEKPQNIGEQKDSGQEQPIKEPEDREEPQSIGEPQEQPVKEPQVIGELGNNNKPDDGEKPQQDGQMKPEEEPESGGEQPNTLPLIFLGGGSIAEEQIVFAFSKPVTIKNISFEPDLQTASIANGSMVKVTFKERYPGMLVTARMIAEDINKNEINVQTTIRLRNSRTPQLVINELCVEMSTDSTGTRAEYIEFKMKTDGNLGGLQVYITTNSTKPKQTIYELPSVEVKKDDYVVLHLRAYDSESRNEYGSNLAESGGRNSSPAARDLWVFDTEKLINKTSIVYIADQDGVILDAVMLSVKGSPVWPNDYMTKAAAFLLEQGVWNGNPIDSEKTTNTRTVCRYETLQRNSKSFADWYIAGTNGFSPGGANK
ncbi:MAG: hypothetical protein FWC06_06035 [Treponema sp.]|nr:hypothetical protein [Treponema sp.]